MLVAEVVRTDQSERVRRLIVVGIDHEPATAAGLSAQRPLPADGASRSSMPSIGTITTEVAVVRWRMVR